MKRDLRLLLENINECYLLGKKELLEADKLEDTRSNTKKELGQIIKKIDNKIISLMFKKLNSGMTNQLKSGFHNISTAKSVLDPWKDLIDYILEQKIEKSKTLKNRLQAEGLFIESRSKKGGDLHLIIGERDGSTHKAHAIVDEKNGEIRVENGQTEPIELVRKIEAIITLESGKRIKTTREEITEEL
jgi:hypothetical protein